MKTFTKRFVTLCLSAATACSLLIPAASAEGVPAQSVEQFMSEVKPGATSTTVLDGVQYTYTCYSDPVDYEYDGHSRTLLGVMEVQTLSDHDAFSVINPNTALYSVYDNGITESFVDMSLPYFIASVAKGESISGSQTKEVEISIGAQFDSEFPAAARTTIIKALKGSFKFEGTAKYITTITVTLSGPTKAGANTRTFYYKKGFHEHSIEIEERLYNDYTGVYATNWYEGFGYEPTYQSYSEDTYVS